jgi:hypothetical protein
MIRGTTAVTTDDLSAPLGQGKTAKRRRVLTIALPHAITGILSIFIAVFAGWALIVKDPFGGEPRVVVRADPGEAKGGRASSDTAANEQPGESAAPVIVSAPPSVPAVNTITIIDGTSGRRQEVLIPMPASSPDDQTGTLDGADASPAKQPPNAPRPKVAAEGSRQSGANARPVKAVAGKPSAPR